MPHHNLTAKLSELAEMLHDLNCSCVISTDGKTTVCRDRGVSDLFRILRDTPELLENASVADKVVGKGAAALMALGKVKEVYADVISRPALDLLISTDIPVAYGECVPNIVNRTRTGLCPVETLCMEASTPAECLPLIADFINRTNN